MIFRNVDNLIIYNYIYLIYRTVNYDTGSREKLVETTKIINRNNFIGFDWMLNRFYRIIKRLQVIYEWKHYFVCILTCKIYPVNSWNFNCHLLCFIAIFIIFWQSLNLRYVVKTILVLTHFVISYKLIMLYRIYWKKNTENNDSYIRYTTSHYSLIYTAQVTLIV